MIYRFKNVDLTEDQWRYLREFAVQHRAKQPLTAQILLDLLEKADHIPVSRRRNPLPPTTF